MKKILQLLVPAVVSMLPCATSADQLHVYSLVVRGPAPSLAQFKEALDPKALPGMAVYSGTISKDGDILIDQTNHEIPSPDRDSKEPRRLGVLLKGHISLISDDSAVRQIKFRFRECKHSAYIYGSGDKRFFPSWTESSVEVSGRIDGEGWALMDTNPEAEAPRQIFLVQVTR